MPFKYVVEMIADYLGAARAYMGKDFTLEKELEWWRNKLKTNPLIHAKTSKFITNYLAQCVKDNKVIRIPYT